MTAATGTTGGIRSALLWLVVVGVILDVAISGILYVQYRQLQHNQAAAAHSLAVSDCWSRVLNNAVKAPATPAARAAIIGQADRCIALAGR